ncbi:unnamed protein product [Owenia fusiformis]|uniref:Uncharacterized protein n=1 Tax=Owenia fusiformis TaxID=6347 RepID=A0A8S4Q5H6_OWEFU|nr:unnamed protein product [Owenia fusiformis]
MKVAIVIFLLVGAAWAQNCNTGADCTDVDAPRCCVSTDRPIGKRSSLENILTIGTCQPIGTEDSGCMVRNNDVDYKSSAVFVNCPCGAGLTCKGNGIIDVPLGEIGTCAKKLVKQSGLSVRTADKGLICPGVEMTSIHTHQNNHR